MDYLKDEYNGDNLHDLLVARARMQKIILDDEIDGYSNMLSEEEDNSYILSEEDNSYILSEEEEEEYRNELDSIMNKHNTLVFAIIILSYYIINMV
jgi:hypothetical protein